MNEIVRYKRPAQVARRVPAVLPAVIKGASRRDVLDELRRRQAAGQVASTGRLWTDLSGEYSLAVQLIQAPRRKSKAKKVAAYSVAAAGALFGLGWWSWLALGVWPLVATGVLVVLVIVALCRATSGGGGSAPGVSVTVTTQVTVR